MRKFLLGLVCGLPLLGVLGAVWNAGWEARPAGTEQASDLDLFIQELKAEIADRAGVEVLFGNASLDNGLNRVGSARAFSQATAPTAITGPGQYNSTAAAFAGTTLSTTEVVGGTDDIGRGRMWVDTDGALTGTVATEPAATGDMQLSAWDETLNGFRRVVARDQGGAGVGAGNLIYNGSFEVTDGTGSAASTAVAAGWTAVLTPTFAYASVNNSTEGDGLAFTTVAAGAALEGASQTLAGLKESTVYVYRVRVAPQSGTCRLLVDDGTSNASATSAAGTATFETLEVLHTTTAGPADVVVSLLSVADTDDCDWDHVTAFERYASFPKPGASVIYTTDSTSDTVIDSTFGNNPFVATTVVVPSAGFIVLVDASVSVTNFANDGACYARLARDDCAGGAFTAISPIAQHNSVNFQSGSNLTLNAVDVAPVPGASCIYRIEVAESSGENCEVNDANIGQADQQSGSWLRAMLLPVQ